MVERKRGHRQPTLYEKWEQYGEDFEKLMEEIDTPELKAKRERIFREYRERRVQKAKNDDHRNI